MGISSLFSLLPWKKTATKQGGIAAVDWCQLPPECFSHVLSLTSPRDSCSASLVSSAFRSAAASDAVWERFLPSDYARMLAEAGERVEDFSSKKAIYFRLCDPILIDEGKMIFSMERSSGRKCYMISARKLGIIWSDVPEYWRWVPHPDSRFSEVAELLQVWHFDVNGGIDCRILSPKTTYAVYLIYKIVPGSIGLSFPSQEASVIVGAQFCKYAVCLDNVNGEVTSDVLQTPRERDDGWMEIEMGEFFNNEEDEGHVAVKLMQFKTLNEKCGLIIEGIEVRPKILIK